MRRALTPYEIARLPPGFIKHIDIDRLRLIDRKHNLFSGNKIVARGYDLYWPNYPSDFTRAGLATRSLLVQELCHVWQYATDRLTAWRYLTRPKNWAYGYEFSIHKAFDDYAIEKQADLLQDWHHMNHGAAPYRYHPQSTAPSLEQINAVIPFEWEAETGDPSGLRVV